MRVRLGDLVFALAFVSAGAQEHRIVAFRVTSQADIPIPNAVIGIQEWDVRANTDSSGRVMVVGNRGKPRVRVRAIGFAPFDSTVSIGDDKSEFVVRMRTLQRLSAVEIRATRFKPSRYDSTSKFDEFYRRRALGWGKFFTREDLERSGQMHTADLLREVVGVRVNKQPGFLEVRFSRCAGNFLTQKASAPHAGDRTVAIYVDGQRLGDDAMGYLDALVTSDVEAMEVYRGPTELPADAVGNACAAIYVWTRYSSGSVLKEAKPR